jgi:lysophospholipase L1-like esterase
MKIVWLTLGAIAAIGVVIELALRYRFGFGRPLLYRGDPAIGYLIAPNQTTRRFGNRIEINQYSMRTGSITPNRSADTLRAFIIGDSVANGGWWTDQSQTISTQLESQLKTSTHNTVEVLNASANSWGPRNELAYLEQFGLFETQYLILIINTDDLFSTTPTSLVVGRDRNYPDRPPLGAIGEVLQRYVLPAPKPAPELQVIQSEGGDRVGKNLAAIQAIHQLAQQHQAKFLLIMTPLRREAVAPGPKNYEWAARSRLQAFTETHRIDYIDALPLFQAESSANSLYHDHIHLNPTGNQRIRDQIAEWISRDPVTTHR